ncbi:phage tail protein, partial [Escherichia coli]|nr:phage tail protein [Escherichia coli]
MPVSRNLCIFLNVGLGETIDKASGAMQKSANGYDISDVSAFRNALQLGTAATRDV